MAGDSGVSAAAAVFAVAASVLVGCGGGEESAQWSGDPDACTTLVAPRGLGLGWELLNHRISLWQMRLSPGGGVCGPDALAAAFVGGDFSTGEVATDTPILRFRWQRIEGLDATRAGVARISLPVRVARGGSASGEIELSREALALRGYREVTALFGGIGWWTDVEQGADYPENYDPRLGFTSRGFGADVEVVDSDERFVRLAWHVRVEHGTTWDRPDHNAAVPFAESEGVLDVVLIGTNDVPVRFADVSYDMEYPEPRPLEDQELPHASPEQQRARLEGEPGSGRGVIGLSGFDLLLDPAATCARDTDCSEGDTCDAEAGMCRLANGPQGYYIRELFVGAELESWDSETGEAIARFDGYASNATTFIEERALRTHARGRIAWIQLPGAEADLGGEVDVEFETGVTRLSLVPGRP